MKGSGNKLYELTVNGDGIRLRHCNPNPLSADHKFYIIMTLSVCATACAIILGFFGLLR